VRRTAHAAFVPGCFTLVRYISATSRVVIATEKLSAVNGGDVVVRKVALKFMKNRDQYEREKESRDFFKDLDNYVVGIYYAFTQQDDRSYREALTNSCVASSATTFNRCTKAHVTCPLTCQQILQRLQGLPLFGCNAVC
jgi:hypothetical protein